MWRQQIKQLQKWSHYLGPLHRNHAGYNCLTSATPESCKIRFNAEVQSLTYQECVSTLRNTVPPACVLLTCAISRVPSVLGNTGSKQQRCLADTVLSYSTLTALVQQATLQTQIGFLSG